MWRVENRGKNLLKKIAYAYRGYWDGEWFINQLDNPANNNITFGSDTDYSIFSTELPYSGGDLIIYVEFEGNGTSTNIFLACYLGEKSPVYVYKSINSGTPVTFLSSEIPADTRYIKVFIRNYHSTYFKARNWMLVSGSTITNYVPSLQQSLESSIELFGYNGVYDEITSDGLVVKRWKKLIISDENNHPHNASDDSGYKTVYFSFSDIMPDAKAYTPAVVVRHDGIQFVRENPGGNPTADLHYYTYSGTLNLGIADSETGFPDDYTPSNDDWKRYFNGWKYVDGTTWQGIGSSATADATTALNYTVKDIDPDADWKPYVVIYQLAEPEYYQVLVNGELYVAPETNYIILPNNAFAVIELETDTQSALDSIFGR